MKVPRLIFLLFLVLSLLIVVIADGDETQEGDDSKGQVTQTNGSEFLTEGPTNRSRRSDWSFREERGCFVCLLQAQAQAQVRLF